MKNKRHLFTVVIIIAFVLAGVIISILVFNKNNTKTKKGNTDNATVIGVQSDIANGTDNSSDDIEQNTDFSRASLIINGIKMNIPRSYPAQLDEDKNLLVNSDDFTMYITVKDGSYDKLMDNPDKLTDSVTDKNYEVIQPITNKKINDREFSYLTYMDEKQENMLIYSEAGLDKHFGIIITIGDMSDDAILSLVYDYVEMSVSTEEADTEYFSMSEIDVENLESDEVFVSSGAISANNNEVKVNYEVPEGFLLAGDVVEDEIVEKTYCFYDEHTSATLNVRKGDAFNSSAEDYIDNEIMYLPDVEKQRDTINGYEIYYFSREAKYVYPEGDEYVECLTMAVDLPYDYYYTVTIFHSGEKINMKYEDYKEFVTLK